jgi:hypothetical protein
VVPESPDAFDWQSLVGPAIAILALLFTIASFWWLQARQGRLRTYEPYFLAYARTPNKALLRFPLVLFNTGAKPLVILDLRLSFPDVPGVPPLPWHGSRSQLRPATEDGFKLPAAFSIPGRTAQQHFIEFGADVKDPLPGIELSTTEYSVLIEVLLGHKKRWKKLLSFPLSATHIEQAGAYLAYSNTALRPRS